MGPGGPRRFKSVLSSLLTNAQHHGRGRNIQVVIPSEPDGIAIEVLDRGPGLSPGDLEHAFDRFYKGDPARADTGSGLGLAIAREKARLQAGRWTRQTVKEVD